MKSRRCRRMRTQGTGSGGTHRCKDDMVIQWTPLTQVSATKNHRLENYFSSVFPFSKEIKFKRVLKEF